MSTFVRFRVLRWGGQVERHEYVRETACYYIRPDGTRDKKETGWYKHFSTEPEAQAALERIKRGEVERIAERRAQGYGPELLAVLDELRETQRGLREFTAAEVAEIQQRADALIVAARGGAQ